MTGTIASYLTSAAGSVAIITSLKIFFDDIRRKKVVGLFKTGPFLINLLFIFGFVYYVYNIDDKDPQIKNLKHSINIALLALIIAFMAYIDMVLAPFWIIFVSSYYFSIAV